MIQIGWLVILSWNNLNLPPATALFLIQFSEYSGIYPLYYPGVINNHPIRKGCPVCRI
jgi:hypothetical protein